MSLRAALSTPEAKSRHVRRLFATIADRYDLITVLLSCGLDRGWKRRLARLADVRPSDRALDLACGTGDITFEIAARGARTVGLDITVRMVELAAAKRGRRRGAGPATGSGEAARDPAAFLAGDMMALPFGNGSFDLVTAGYGLRNVPVLEPALREVHRVLKPAGRFLSLDFNRPANPVVRALYLSYLTAVGSVLGMALHGDPDTYRYIPESIRRYPGAGNVAGLLRRVGFREADHVRVLGGLMAIHRARR